MKITFKRCRTWGIPTQRGLLRSLLLGLHPLGVQGCSGSRPAEFFSPWPEQIAAPPEPFARRAGFTCSACRAIFSAGRAFFSVARASSAAARVFYSTRRVQRLGVSSYFLGGPSRWLRRPSILPGARTLLPGAASRDLAGPGWSSARCGSSSGCCAPEAVYRVAVGSMPIVLIHASARLGQRVIGFDEGRSPNACPPCAYRCISTGTSACFSAA